MTLCTGFEINNESIAQMLISIIRSVIVNNKILYSRASYRIFSWGGGGTFFLLLGSYSEGKGVGGMCSLPCCMHFDCQIDRAACC